MNVAFDHHSPFLLAHGGFSIQIEQTFSALRRNGTNVEFLRWWSGDQTPNLIHYFGPAPSWYLDFCSTKEIRTVVSVLLTSLGSRPPWQTRLQGSAIRGIRSLIPRMAERMGWDAYLKADAYISLTQHEGRLLNRVFGVPQEKIHIIPNGVDGCFLEASTVPREDWLMTSCTITPRKRVIELVEAAALSGRRLKVFGKPYSPSDPYFQAFLQAVEKNRSCVEYAGEISDRSELAGLYRRAAGFALISTMESQSLSALEAASCQCPLVLSDLPWARETFPTGALFLPPTASPRDIAQALKLLDNLPAPAPAASWEAVAESLRRLYDRICDPR
jgi:glycosyltransferase involved in cell wall biosynthesis